MYYKYINMREGKGILVLSSTHPKLSCQNWNLKHQFSLTTHIKHQVETISWVKLLTITASYMKLSEYPQCDFFTLQKHLGLFIYYLSSFHSTLFVLSVHKKLWLFCILQRSDSNQKLHTDSHFFLLSHLYFLETTL